MIARGIGSREPSATALHETPRLLQPESGLRDDACNLKRLSENVVGENLAREQPPTATPCSNGLQARIEPKHPISSIVNERALRTWAVGAIAGSSVWQIDCFTIRDTTEIGALGGDGVEAEVPALSTWPAPLPGRCLGRRQGCSRIGWTRIPQRL